MSDCNDTQPDEDGVTLRARPCPDGCPAQGWNEHGVYAKCPNCGALYCWRVRGAVFLKPGEKCPECGTKHADREW